MYRNEKTRKPFKRGGKSKGKGAVIEQKKKDVLGVVLNYVQILAW